MLNNASVDAEPRQDVRKAKKLVNSIDYSVHVARLPIVESRHTGVYLYNSDNLYPYKVIEISKRSPALQTALKTYAKFMRGNGFEGGTSQDSKNNTSIIVNDKGLNAYQLLRFVAKQRSEIGFALHLQYNNLGEITAINPVEYSSVRRKFKEKKDTFEKYVIYHNWHNSGYVDTDKMFTAFAYNPDPLVIRDQIKESGGIDNYPGQLFYWKDTNRIYPLATFDSVLDPAQLEAEANLYELSNVQNGFSVSGILKIPANSDSVAEQTSLKKKLSNTQGSLNAGRLLTIPYSPANPPTTSFFESITLPNVDTMHQNQKQDAKRTIYELYNQPGIINGRSDSGMFNQQSMQDAYDFYNSITETDRNDIENALTELFEHSVFDVKLPIEIEPLLFISSHEQR